MEQGSRTRTASTDSAEAPAAPPRYLRFVCALVLGSALVAAPVVMSGCGNGGSCNNTRPMPVDGPLPPPDLPLEPA